MAYGVGTEKEKRMASNIEKYKSDMDSLVSLGEGMVMDLQFRVLREQNSLKKEQMAAAKLVEGSFEREYQRWFTEACAVIRQLIPDRMPEFEQQRRRQE